MNDVIQKIQDILLQLDESTQMKVILECASKMGTQEWQDAVKDLMQRMDALNKIK